MSEMRPKIIKRKKVVAGHGHHGGAWKVAYADFVTAMMALFMVLWLLASTDSATRSEISRYFRTGILPDGDMSMNRAAQTTPSVIERSPTPGKEENAIDADAKELNSAIKKMASSDPELKKLAKQISVKVTPEGILIEAVDSDGEGAMLFDLSSAKLKPALITFLQHLGAMLGARTNKLHINGHTDARPFAAGAGKTNWDLSFERADAARKILEGHGVASDQITAVRAHGPAEPLDPSDPYAASNRRLSILIVRDPSQLATRGKPARKAADAGPDAVTAPDDSAGKIVAPEAAAAHGESAPAVAPHGDAAPAPSGKSEPHGNSEPAAATDSKPPALAPAAPSGPPLGEIERALDNPKRRR